MSPSLIPVSVYCSSLNILMLPPRSRSLVSVKIILLLIIRWMTLRCDSSIHFSPLITVAAGVSRKFQDSFSLAVFLELIPGCAGGGGRPRTCSPFRESRALPDAFAQMEVEPPGMHPDQMAEAPRLKTDALQRKLIFVHFYLQPRPYGLHTAP